MWINLTTDRHCAICFFEKSLQDSAITETNAKSSQRRNIYAIFHVTWRHHNTHPLQPVFYSSVSNIITAKMSHLPTNITVKGNFAHSSSFPKKKKTLCKLHGTFLATMIRKKTNKNSDILYGLTETSKMVVLEREKIFKPIWKTNTVCIFTGIPKLHHAFK